jgi:hypothetical protein
MRSLYGTCSNDGKCKLSHTLKGVLLPYPPTGKRFGLTASRNLAVGQLLLVTPPLAVAFGPAGELLLLGPSQHNTCYKHHVATAQQAHA